MDITLFCNKSWIVPFKSKPLSLFSSLLWHKSADKRLDVRAFFFSFLRSAYGTKWSKEERRVFFFLFVAQLLSQTTAPLSKERSYNILLKMIEFFQQRHHPCVAGFPHRADDITAATAALRLVTTLRMPRWLTLDVSFTTLSKHF